jgi:hypothetical protein
MVSLKRTSDVQSHHLKILVYGAAGAGKTRLIGTAKDPLIISAESGLLSLRDIDVPYIEVKTLADVQDAYTFVSTPSRRSRRPSSPRRRRPRKTRGRRMAR